MYIIDKSERANKAKYSRQADLHELQKSLSSNDPAARQMAAKAIEQVKREQSDKHILSMRQALIDAHRSNNQAEIQDIHDIVAKKSKYQHE